MPDIAYRYWYCCQCRFGPQSVHVTPDCLECHHRRCLSCEETEERPSYYLLKEPGTLNNVIREESDVAVPLDLNDGPSSAPQKPIDSQQEIPNALGGAREDVEVDRRVYRQPFNDSGGTYSAFDVVDSSSSGDDASIFSAADSDVSTSTSGSGVEGIHAIFVRSFAALICEDDAMQLLISTAVLDRNIGWGKARDKFRWLLKRYAEDLRIECQNEHHRAVTKFVRSSATRIASEVFSRLSINNQEVTFQIPGSARDSADYREKVEDHLRKTLGPTEHPIEPPDPSEDSDQDSPVEESEHEEPHDDSLSHFDEANRFALHGIAYQALHRRLHNIVYPSLGSRLEDLIASWSRPNHRYHSHITHYKLHNLAAELRHIDPYQIQINYKQESNPLHRVINHGQNLMELWTGEHWDWWPLSSPNRLLLKKEARLRWKCTCGEDRRVEVPLPFAKRLGTIIQALPRSSIPTHIPQPPSPSSYGASNSQPRNGGNLGHGQSSRSNQDYHQPVNPTFTNTGPPYQAQTLRSNSPNHRVLFIVKRGTDYKLAQIGVQGLSCRGFFGALRENYFRLRGRLRSWLSIWRYSHCDFYMFEKFDEYEFTPKEKNAFPAVNDGDYEYQPKPMDTIPPISEHEFRTRFYACDKSSSTAHWYHNCKRLGAHSYDILQFFPKKKTKLQEDGDKRERFWGIYARETIAFRWVVFYNLICVLPMIAFFLGRIHPNGESTDLQDPSVPLSLMLGMLSVFWSLFFSSLNFG